MYDDDKANFYDLNFYVSVETQFSHIKTSIQQLLNKNKKKKRRKFLGTKEGGDY
jgi:hypothetical protein